MAVEPRRGCGHRKVGGLYVVGDTLNAVADWLPLELHVCAACNQGVKQIRGWSWIIPRKLFTKPIPDYIGERVGLLWVGGKFYPEPGDFLAEANHIGVSRRLAAMPRGFKIGDWVFIAHPHGVKRAAQDDVEICEATEAGQLNADGTGTYVVRPGIIAAFQPRGFEKIVTETQYGDADAMVKLTAKGITPVPVPDDDADHQGSVFDKAK